MKESRNATRLHGPVDVSSPWEALKKWARKKITNEKVAEVGLSLAAAVSLCYLGSRIFVGLQNYVMYTY